MTHGQLKCIMVANLAGSNLVFLPETKGSRLELSEERISNFAEIADKIIQTINEKGKEEE